MLKKPKILFFDMETSPLKAWVWGCGDQTVRHGQLVKGHSRYGIICITYCWNDGKPAKSIDWGYKQQNTAKVVAEFDKIIAQADHIIGKNNNRFDNKMLNAARMFAGLPGCPDWVRYTDDLERQMRRYFRVPSYSLDYISNELGFGGKIKMELQDWIDIVEKTSNGLKSFKKMIKYGKKDVVDTRDLWNKLSEHFEPKFNMATHIEEKVACRQCGNTNLSRHDIRCVGLVRYQRFHRCKQCGYGGNRAPLSKVRKQLGKVQ